MQTPDENSKNSSDSSAATKSAEARLFLFITIVLFPALSIALVGSYGFAIWIMQIIFGPPAA